jgi:hypothetical protein
MNQLDSSFCAGETDHEAIYGRSIGIVTRKKDWRKPQKFPQGKIIALGKIRVKGTPQFRIQ